MRKNHVHIICIFFGSIILLPLFFLITLQLWQLYLTHSAEERMEAQSLITIIADAEKLVWQEEEREVTIDGEFFDVKSYTRIDNKYVLTGVFDKKETQIHQMLIRQSKTSISVFQLLLMGQCFAAFFIYATKSFLFKTITRKYGRMIINYSSLYREITNPPPRLIMAIV